MLLLAAILLVSLLLLAQGLSEVHFRPGSIPHREHHPQPVEPAHASGEFRSTVDWLTPLWLGWNLVTAVALLAFAILAIFIPRLQQEFIAAALIIALAALAFNLLHYYPPVFTRDGKTLPGLSLESPSAEDHEGIVVPTPPRWSAFILLSLILSGAGALLWHLLSRMPSRTRREAGDSLEQSVKEARRAAESKVNLRLQDTIIRCYHGMSRLLVKRKMITDYQALTPREFEERLRALGVADEHISLLSRLFERVRYGHHRAAPDEEQMAQRALREIKRSYMGEEPKSESRSEGRWALELSLSR